MLNRLPPSSADCLNQVETRTIKHIWASTPGDEAFETRVLSLTLYIILVACYDKINFNKILNGLSVYTSV